MRLKFKKKLKKNENENENKGLIIEPNKKEEPERDWFTKQYEKAIGKPPPRAKLTTEEVLERLKELAKNVRANEVESVKSPEPQTGPVDYFKWSEPRIKTCKCPDEDCSCRREAMFPAKKIPRGERYFNSPLTRKLRRFFKKPAPPPSKGFMERLADVAGIEADMYKDMEKKGILNIGGAEFCPSRCINYYGPGHIPNYNKHLLAKENLRFVQQVTSTSDTLENKKDMYKCDGGDKHSTVSTQSTIGPEGKLIDNFSHVLFGTLEEYIVNHIDGTELRMSFYKCGDDNAQSATVNICLDKMLSLRDHLNMQGLKTHVSMLKQKIYSSVFDIKTKRPDVRSLPTQYEEEELKKNSSEKITIATPYKGVVIKVKKKPEECITISQVELNPNQQQNNENDNILPTEVSLKSDGSNNNESNENKMERLPNKENKSEKIQSYTSINNVSLLQKATVCDSLQNKLANNTVDLHESSRMDFTTANLNKSSAPSSNCDVANEIEQNKEELQIKDSDNILLVPASKPSNVSNDSSNKIMSMLKKLKQSISKKSQSSSFMDKQHNFVSSTINEKSSDYVPYQLSAKPSEIHQSPHMEVLEKDMEDKSSITNKQKDLTNDTITNLNQLQQNEYDSTMPQQNQITVNTSEIHQSSNTEVLINDMEDKSSITSKHKDLTNDNIENTNQLQNNEFDSIFSEQLAVNTSEIHQCPNTDVLQKYMEYKSSITSKHKDLTNKSIENLNQLQNNKYDSILPQQVSELKNMLNDSNHQTSQKSKEWLKKLKQSISKKNKSGLSINKSQRSVSQVQIEKTCDSLPKQLTVNISEIHQSSNMKVLENEENESSISSKSDGLVNVQSPSQQQNTECGKVSNKTSRIKYDPNQALQNKTQNLQNVSKKSRSGSNKIEPSNCITSILNENVYISSHMQISIKTSKKQTSSNIFTEEDMKKKSSIYSKNNILTDGAAQNQHKHSKQHIKDFNNIFPNRSKSSESVKMRKSESEAINNNNDLLLKKSNTQELSMLAKLNQRKSNKKQLHSFIKESLNYVSSRHMEFTVKDMGQKYFMSNKSNDLRSSIMENKDILIEMKKQRSNLNMIEFENSNNFKNSKDMVQKSFMSNKSKDLNRIVMENKEILKQKKQHQSNLAIIEFETSNKSQDKILTGNKEKNVETQDTPTPLVSRMCKLFNRLFYSPSLHELYKNNKVNYNKTESNINQNEIASNDETNRSKETQEYISSKKRTHTEPDKNSHFTDNFNENVNTNEVYNSRNVLVPSYQATVDNKPDTSNEKYFEVNVTIKSKVVNKASIKHPYLSKTTSKSSIPSNMLFWKKKNCYVKSLPENKLQNDSLKQSHNQKYMSEVQPKRCLKSSEIKKNDDPKTSEKEIFSYQYSTMGEVKSTQ